MEVCHDSGVVFVPTRKRKQNDMRFTGWIYDPVVLEATRLWSLSASFKSLGAACLCMSEFGTEVGETG